MVGHSTRAVGVGLVLLCAVLSAFPLAGPAVGSAGETPLAEAGLDQQVLRGETVRLDATGSYDPDGSVVAYEWRIRSPAGRSVSPAESRDARTTFTASTVGRYEVELTVTDRDGNTGTDAMYVRVETRAGGVRGATDGNGSTARVVPVTPAARNDTGTPAVRTPPLETTEPAASDESTVHPWVRVVGPTVVVAENSYTYEAETSGVAGSPSFDWDGGDTGRRHTLYFRTGGEYTTRVTVEGERGRSASDGLEVFVASADNERPEVEIADPEHVVAGEHLRLSVEASDPDGVVRSTEWSPGRTVEVPEDGSSRTVRVTVTDDDGASVTDSLTVTGRAVNQTMVGTDTTDVTCYFTDERQRDGRLPVSDRCIPENANTASLRVGSSRIESWRRNEHVDLHWRRTTEDVLNGLDADDTSTDYGTAVASPQDEADTYGQSDDPVRRSITEQWVTVDNTEAFTLKGKTVEDDLDDDGEVNAADWDLRYRTSSDTTEVDRHADAAAAFKRSLRGIERESDLAGAFESPRRADARTVEDWLVGTSIEAETARDEIAQLSHRTSIVGPSRTGGSSTTASSSGVTDTNGGGEAGDGDHSDDGDEGDDDFWSGLTDGGAEWGGDDGDDEGTDDDQNTDDAWAGSPVGGQSVQSPQGGWFPTHP